MEKTMRDLSAVLIVYRKNRTNHRLLFGEPISEIRLGWHRKLVVFKPGQIFGYERWRADQYGTQDWRFFVLQATISGSTTSVPGVFPGAEILLATRGKTRTQRALALLDVLAIGPGALAAVTPNYWRQVHNAIEIGSEPHGFTTLQRHAYLGNSLC